MAFSRDWCMVHVWENSSHGTMAQTRSRRVEVGTNGPGEDGSADLH